LVKEFTDPGSPAESSDSFSHELLTGLQHPNLLAILDHFIVPGQGKYVILDSAAGQSLRQRLTEIGPLPYTEVVPLLLNLSDVIYYLHDRQPPLIHGKIGLDSIFRDLDGKVSLLFTGYQPDAGEKLSIQSDIFDLGKTAYTLLTNQPPPENSDLGQIKTQLQSEFPSIPPTIAAMISQSIGPKPERRFGTSEDFKAALLYALVQIPPETLRTSPLSVPLSQPVRSEGIEAGAATETPDQPQETPVKPEPTTPIRRRVPWGLL
jgi:serine/threonine protein kinase